MKYVFLILMLVSFAFILDGCKADPCKSVRCENGGICVDGECVCHDITSGANCTNCLCQNGGTCDGGRECNCPPDYEGKLCETYNP